MLRKALVVSLGFFVVSCKKDKPLTLQKTPYFGTELQTNGYYYSSVMDEEGVERFSIIVLYRDGTLLMPGIESSKTTSLSAIESEIVNGAIDANSADFKRSWGLFIVESDTLVTESWFPTLFRGLHAVQSRVFIENDSTLVVQPTNMKGGLPQRTYYFREFNPKPDSVNAFV